MGYTNKEDQKKAARKHYEANAQKIKERAIAFNEKARERNRNYIAEYLSTHPCVDCGEDNIIVLEFDHVNGEKINNISDAVKQCWSIKKIQTEIDKCEVRCANCHRIVTHQRRNKK